MIQSTGDRECEANHAIPPFDGGSVSACLRPSISCRATTIFQAGGGNVTLKTLEVAVRFIRPDVALAHVTNELSGLIGPEGQTLPAHQELSIRVLVKDQGVWRITAFHNTILQK